MTISISCNAATDAAWFSTSTSMEVALDGIVETSEEGR